MSGKVEEFQIKSCFQFVQFHYFFFDINKFIIFRLIIDFHLSSMFGKKKIKEKQKFYC